MNIADDALTVSTATDMENLGGRISRGFVPGQIIFLRGDLGVGKTTFVRGALRGLDHQGPVKSPTYTLLEPYYIQGCNVYHFDLYRLRHSEELEDLAFRDYLDGSGVCLIEWPERGLRYLPTPDCLIDIEYENDGRCFKMHCATELGSRLCASLR